MSNPAPAPCPIKSVDLAIAKVARDLESCPSDQLGKLAQLTEHLDDLVRARGALIQQETSQWRAWVN